VGSSAGLLVRLLDVGRKSVADLKVSSLDLDLVSHVRDPSRADVGQLSPWVRPLEDDRSTSSDDRDRSSPGLRHSSPDGGKSSQEVRLSFADRGKSSPDGKQSSPDVKESLPCRRQSSDDRDHGSQRRVQSVAARCVPNQVGERLSPHRR
jgi:hypothetical protein